MSEYTNPNLVTTHLFIRGEVPMHPSEMLDCQPSRLPIEGDYVPLFMFKRPFDVVRPTLEAVGDAAVRLSLGKDFGFMMGSKPNLTQLTPDIVFAKELRDPRWVMAVQTPQPLGALEEVIFSIGGMQYARVMHEKMNTPPNP